MDGSFLKFFAGEFFQQAAQPLAQVLPGALKVAGVPRVGHLLPGAAAVVEYEGDLALAVAVSHAAQVAQVGGVHADDEVVLVVLLTRHAVSRVPGAADAVLGELPARRRVYTVAHLLVRRSR